MTIRYDELDNLIRRYPVLEPQKEQIRQAAEILVKGYENGGKLLICGNGGSASDSEHIVGELMKEFRRHRPVQEKLAAKIAAMDPGSILPEQLRGAFPAIALNAHTALGTALINDCDPAVVFAQQVYGYGREGDMLIGLSTSGNSANVRNAVITAKAIGMKTILICGERSCTTDPFCDVAVHLPETETYKVQELTLPVYHALCIVVEDSFYG